MGDESLGGRLLLGLVGSGGVRSSFILYISICRKLWVEGVVVSWSDLAGGGRLKREE